MGRARFTQADVDHVINYAVRYGTKQNDKNTHNVVQNGERLLNYDFILH